MNNKLNVLFLGSFLYPNGYAATKRKQQFLDFIIKEGHNARVLITLKWSSSSHLNDNEGVFKSIPYEVLGRGIKKNVFFPFSFFVYLFRAGYKILKHKKTKQKNIVVAFGISFHNIIPLMFAKVVGYKIVFDIVEDIGLSFNRGSLKNILKRIIDRWAHVLIKNLNSGVSVITTKLADKYLTVSNKQPIVLIPVSASNLYNTSFKKTEDKRYFKVLYSGTYGEKEGLHTLFGAFKAFSDKYSNVVLILTGNCPEETKSFLFKLFKSYQKIIFTGRLDDYEYYQELMNSDVLLMTRTNSEYANAGFPYKLGEYLATGNPVIATKVSDVEKYLENEVSAYLIDADSTTQLVDALIKVYFNKKEANDVGLNGKDVCKKHFNPIINSAMFYKMLLNC